jgi:hypothetical protein
VGNNYAVIPTSELDDDTRAWLVEAGVVVPLAMGRWPSMRELRATLEALDGYTVEYRITSTGDWDVDVRSARGDAPDHATIWATATALPDDACKFNFHKPNEQLVLRILERLSHVCGPFVIIEGSGMSSVVVTAGSDPRELYELWHRDQQSND